MGNYEADDQDIEGADDNVEDGMDERHLRWQWCPRNHQKAAPFCIHAGARPRECDPHKCCWKRGRGCLMRHYSSSSSVGAVILWVLLALLLLGGGLFDETLFKLQQCWRSHPLGFTCSLVVGWRSVWWLHCCEEKGYGGCK